MSSWERSFFGLPLADGLDVVALEVVEGPGVGCEELALRNSEAGVKKGFVALMLEELFRALVLMAWRGTRGGSICFFEVGVGQYSLEKGLMDLSLGSGCLLA